VDCSGGDAVIPYPPGTSMLHHEVELVVLLGKGGRFVAPSEASSLAAAYGVGVDLTRRDLQAEAKRAGRPWDVSKGFDCSGPCGALTAARDVGDLRPVGMKLTVNGEVRQASTLDHMIWSVPDMLSRLSELYELRPGDLLFTGTPAGVGALEVGDVVEAEVEGLEACRFVVGAPLE